MEIKNSILFLFLSFPSILTFSTDATPISTPSISPIPSPTKSPIPLFRFPKNPPVTTSTALDPSLIKICSITEDPTKCVEFIAPFLSGSPTDPVSVLNMFIEGVYKHVERSISLLDKSAKKYSRSPVVSRSLDDCLQSYHKIKIELVKTESSVGEKDINTVNSLLTGMISNFGQCDESFHKNGMEESPMREISEILTELVGFSVDISDKLILKKN